VAVLRGHLPDLVQQEDIARLGMFGSYVRNEQTPTSDLDVLVEFSDRAHHGLMTVAGIEHHLSDLLGVKGDLVLVGALRGNIGRRILNEVMWLSL
jgi:hypothetical protein